MRKKKGFYKAKNSSCWKVTTKLSVTSSLHFSRIEKVEMSSNKEKKNSDFQQKERSLQTKNISLLERDKTITSEARPKAEPGVMLRPVCKALNYWADKSEQNILRTTTLSQQKVTLFLLQNLITFLSQIFYTVTQNFSIFLH